MKVIGFNIDTIHAKKSFDFKRTSISTNVMFTEVDKANLDLIKDSESLKISFKFNVNYKNGDKKESTELNEVLISGSMILMVTKDESKEFLKSWKNKEIPKDKALGLYNVVLKKCSVKALQLEEEIGLSPHIPFPQIRNQQTK